MKLTPRIFRDAERSISDGDGGSGICRDFCLGSINVISVDLDRLSVSVLIRPVFDIFNFGISGMLLAGITMYVSSAYLHNIFPADTVYRSPMFTKYKAGPIEDPWIMLAKILGPHTPTVNAP